MIWVIWAIKKGDMGDIGDIGDIGDMGDMGDMGGMSDMGKSGGWHGQYRRRAALGKPTHLGQHALHHVHGHRGDILVGDHHLRVDGVR